jgi:hypothetical protein
VKFNASKRKGKPFERMGRKTFNLKDSEIFDFEFRNSDLPQSHGGWVAEVEEISQLIHPYFAKCP